MAVAIPTADLTFTFDPDTGIPSSTTRAEINNGATKGTVNVKAAGNLPLTSGASSWQFTIGEFGYVFELQTGNLDVSTDTKLLVWSWQHNAPNRIQQDTVANDGVQLRLYSGTGTSNWRKFVISGQDVFGGSSQLGPVPMVIDMNASSFDSETGTFDNTNVDAYGLVQNYASQNGTAGPWVFVQRAHVFDTAKNATNIVKFTGASDFDDLVDGVLGTSYTNKIGAWVTKLSATYFVPIAFQIGDTSTATNFDCVGKTIVSPADNDAGDPRFRLSTQGVRVYIDLRNNAADDADLQDSTWNWGVAAAFDFDVSNAATISIGGAVFGGMGDFTLGSSVTGGAVFNLAAGFDVIVNGANIDGSDITGTGDLLLNSDTDLTNVTVAGDLRIATGTNATIVLTDCTITGNIFNDSALNTLTVQLVNSTGTTTEAGTGNGQVNLENPVTVIVHAIDSSDSSNVQDARVLVVAAETVGTITTGDTILTGVTPASGFVEDTAFNYEAAFEPSGLDVTVTVRKGTASPYYKPFSTSSVITSAGLDISVPMVSDE